MDGILIVNKESGYTSRDVVNIVSHTLGVKKIGHTGTLDPMATGVLVLCIGKATKLVELLTADDKEYIAQIKLGILTDTLDITGNVIKSENKNVDENDIKEAVDSMKGEYLEEVPIYSAIRINGKRLYEYAREGKDVVLPKREVVVKNIKLVGDINYNDNITFSIQTLVSKGTYIRSLVRDIAYKLNTIGVMSNLIRTKEGIFDIKDSYTIDDIKSGNYKLITIDEALSNIYVVNMDDALYKKVSNGVQIDNTYNSDVVLFKYNNSSVALYKNYNNILKMWKMFN